MSGEMVDLLPSVGFYAGCHVLVTGATGFLGKVLLEKLLHVCPDVDTIYLLARSKKGKSPEERVRDMCESPLFDRLRKSQPKFEHKLRIIEGDCALPNMGISQTDKELIVSKVSIVFHVAATVRFDEKLRIAGQMNVLATRDLLEMCREMKHLKSVVHVSTAFSHCTRSNISEQFYDPGMDPDRFIGMIKLLDDSLLDKITPDIIDPWPNTYTYTKAIAEALIQKYYYDLPIIVARPSIVISSVKEPVAGWLDNLYGPVGLSCGVAVGIYSAIDADKDTRADLVPVDMVVNSILYSSYYGAKKHREIVDAGRQKMADDVFIFNFVLDPNARMTWGDFCDNLMRLRHKYALKKCLWPPNAILGSESRLTYFVHNTLKAHFLDLVLRLGGEQPHITKFVKKIDIVIGCLYFFTHNSFAFSRDKTEELISAQTALERRSFPCDIRSVDWPVYWEAYLAGLVEFVFKESPQDLPGALAKMRRMEVTLDLVRAAFVLLVAFLAWRMLAAILF